jgi:Peptidase family M41
VTDSDELRATAFHEAGHAVVGAVLGFDVLGVTVIADGKFAGSCWSYAANERASANDRIIVLFAGACAERLIDPTAADCPNDESEVLALSRRQPVLPRSARVADAYLSSLRHKAAQLVRNNSRAIGELAGELLRRGTLDGAEVHAIIRPMLVGAAEANRHGTYCGS